MLNLKNAVIPVALLFSAASLAGCYYQPVPYAPPVYAAPGYAAPAYGYTAPGYYAQPYGYAPYGGDVSLSIGGGERRHW